MEPETNRDDATVVADHDQRRGRATRTARRRAVLIALGGAAASLAGCAGFSDPADSSAALSHDAKPWEDRPDDRPEPGGTSMRDLPAMSGELTVFSGRSERLVAPLLDHIDALNPDLSLSVLYGSASQLASRVLSEGQNARGDVVYSINVPGTLGALAAEGRTAALPDRVLSTVPRRFRDGEGQWVATSGRARAVPYNTDMTSPAALPDDVMAFPDREALRGAVGWAPRKASFHGFVTAMRVLEGDARTREWLEGMVDLDAQAYGGGFATNRAIADGEIAAGFTNHYYHKRVLAGRPDPPIDVTYTAGDAASVLTGAGAGVVDSTRNPETAATFVRYLLSAEAQEYFAIPDRYEYPVVEGVEPLDSLPPLSSLRTPDLRLDDLTDLAGTLDLLRDVGLV